MTQASLAGQLLLAAPTLLDPNFARTVVLVGMHNEEGAMGVVLNRPSTLTVGEAVPQLEEVLLAKHGGHLPDLVTIAAHQKVGEGIDTMQRYGISQLPVVRDGECESITDVIGSLQDRALLERVFANPDVLHEDVASAMQPPLAAIDASATMEEVFGTLTGGTNAVVVAREGKPVGVLTRSDLLEFLARRR